MRHRRRGLGLIAAIGALTVTGVIAVPAAAQAGRTAPGTNPAPGPTVQVSTGKACAGQNAEVETAIDPATRILYEEWIGCGGIGFARSTDGGKTFSTGYELPGSAGGWDPAIVTGPHGRVYAAFMVFRHTRSYPVVDISADHGRSFPLVRTLVAPHKNNWGDRDFIAVSRTGTIYVTWDYGPHNLTRKDFVCAKNGSCSFVAGDLNVVLQRSADNGRTWSKITPISPGFPGSGADSAPVIIEPGGRLAVLYQGYQILNRKTLKLGVAHSFFTSSADGGRRWSRPQRLGPARLSMNTTEWWIDGSIGQDFAGDLYATWDTQSGGHDIAWLTWSADHGRTWSPLIRVSRHAFPAMRLVQVLGGRGRVAYIGLLTDGVQCRKALCYAQYIRAFSPRRGWLTPLTSVSPVRGNSRVWPGDTLGMSLYPGGGAGTQRVAISWGSAIGGRKASSQIRAAIVGRLP
ncbi:MAG: sialidase family protein [Streptosporangiaceae bacterium]